MLSAYDTPSPHALPRNAILRGDCVALMAHLPPETVDFILTDPPYAVRYRDRSGRRVRNDDNYRWLKPSAEQMYRLLKPGCFAVSFYAWNRADLFLQAWRAAGFRAVGHLIFRKQYASAERFVQYRHEAAYLLAKGDVTPPAQPLPDVLDWQYTGNVLHPTQKPVASLKPLLDTFCPAAGLVLDPFCGSGSTLVAARELGRDYLGMELDGRHHRTATLRLQCPSDTAA
jgi:site-specific DNA-methyltransferase (adenine-specific)